MAQMRFRQLSTSNNNDNNAAWTAFAAATGTENGARSWVPLETSIRTGAAVVTTAPTGIQSYTYKWEINGLLSGSGFTLGAGVVSALGEHGVTIPAALVADLGGGTNAKRHNIDTDKNNTPPNQNSRYSFEYNVTLEEGLCWFQAGNAADNISIAGTNRFTTWDWADNVGVTTTEATTQIPWPVTGIFKYFVVIPGITGGDTADFALRINGADAKVFNATGGVNQLDTVSEVSITAGQLVNWRFNRTSGAGTSCSCLLLAGFIGTGF